MPFDKAQCLEDLEVDVHNLSEQWAEQPTLYLNYAFELSGLVKKRSKTRKKLIDKIVAEPEKYGLAKISDVAITRITDHDIDIINLTYEIDCYSWAVKSFYQRKESLEHEQQLLIGGFHADPKEKPIKKELKKRRA